MATTTIPWNDGSGDNIYLTYPAASGNQTVVVTSDANTGAARTKTVTFTSGVGNITQNLTVNQAAGSPYVMSDLVLWLDGIDKGPDNTAWVDRINGYSFENHGAGFNTDHIYLDGTAYLELSGFTSPGSDTGTIEVVYEKVGTYGIIFVPANVRNFSYLGFGFVQNYGLMWVARRTNRSVYTNAPSKGSVSISLARALGNGSALSAGGNSYMSLGTGAPAYIGKRTAANSNFTGKIYCIRCYNRQLTEQEVLANLAADNERFNLGLTL